MSIYDSSSSSSSQEDLKIDSTKKSKIHHFHRHGDLELRSTEGTIFRVYSAQLADVSSVFASMIEIGDANTPTGSKRGHNLPSEPLEMETASTVLEHFLEMMPMMHPRVPRRLLGYRDTIRLYDFCLKFDVSKRITMRVRTKVCETVRYINQWDLLLWSSQKLDISLAKEALKSMTTFRFLNPNIHSDYSNGTSYEYPDFKKTLARLPASWQLELLRLTLEDSTTNRDMNKKYVDESPTDDSLTNSPVPSAKPTYYVRITDDWECVSNEFNPGPF